MRLGTKGGGRLGLVVLIVVVAFNLGPLAWMVSSSFKSDEEIQQYPPTWLPERPTFSAYQEIWTDGNFVAYFANSAIVATTTTLLSALIGLLAGYGFSRFGFRGRGLLLTLFLVSQMLPGVLLVGPYFKVLTFTKLYNTQAGLIIALATITLPFSTWMLKGYIDSVPKEMDEAALIDGCSRWGALFHAVLPSVAPGLVATIIYAFLLAWGDLLWALCLTTTDSRYTLPVALARLVGEFRIQWAQIMAGASIALIPPLIIYAFLSRLLVRGLTAGSVKS